jgi:hypothetical protein
MIRPGGTMEHDGQHHRPFRTDYILGDEPGTVCRANFQRPCRDEVKARGLNIVWIVVLQLCRAYRADFADERPAIDHDLVWFACTQKR